MHIWGVSLLFNHVGTSTHGRGLLSLTFTPSEVESSPCLREGMAGLFFGVLEKLGFSFYAWQVYRPERNRYQG
jgi:hypothetical protein